MLCIALTTSLALAGVGPTVTKAYIDNKGSVHIITVGGHDEIIHPRKWQVGGGYESVTVAPDGKTVGWLADQMLTPIEGATNYSYPVAFELDIWRGGQVIRRFSVAEFAIQNWVFLKGGGEVAFHTAPPHGQEYFNCALFDVASGKQLAKWQVDRRDYVVPDWARPLLVNADLPTPDEFDQWYPQTSRPGKSAAKPRLN